MIEKEREIAIAYRDGTKTNLICEQHDISISTLYRIVQKYNLPQRNKQTTKYIPEDEHGIIKDYLAKMHIPEICHRHHIDKSTLYAVLRRNNVQRRLSSMPDALKDRVVEEYQRGTKVKCIAQRCGFRTTKAVYSVLNERGIELRIDPLTEEDRKFCVEQFSRGVCVSRIERRSGTRLPLSTAQRILQESGITFIKKPKFDIDTNLARKRFLRGESLSKIAADFGVVTQTLINYMRRDGIDTVALRTSVAAKTQNKPSENISKEVA